ncbi:metallophosphoesterase [Desulfobacter hydrogenophilus]|uniref:Metallophosphoesterase n=1 Tax=Desulfobacter hydrogenophilus TaxID=2291 RepID=A0A328FCC6_9BACT|nr:metallophosphoesterase [Desulfobacter hydrogenophilus]NDY71725.1 twin-arginine translocation signal domain-containing protein [Desulfobacter hydrogenophilus]QBH13233.1 twin-arginine translocation signal domain-containing protein [Desulfobacter hydrogenophilus]RAM02344.1 metallophosphoesterase [Desulfobacter hydrogenophilus]
MKKTMDRRRFLKYSGAGLVGLGLSTLNMPFFRLGKASAAISGDAWCFGVMSDTQWKSDAEASGGENTCATGIIDALNQQFIEHNCKFVIQVGDLVDKDSYDYSEDGSHNLVTRAAHCEVLYNEGIGFFPLRGNHEPSQAAAEEFVALWPQTQNSGDNVNGATNFVQSDIEGLKGLSYSFDYENVRCVMIDQFTRLNGTGTSLSDNVVDQVAWVDEMVSSRPDDYHAFVLAHKNLIGGNHKDNLFGNDLTANANSRDEFIESLDTNNVACCIGGHDHMHHRSLVSDDSGDYKVQQLITSSNSYKFYTPRSGDDGRETMLQEELYTIGYYIFTVDGPRVTVDFYASSTGEDYASVSLRSYTQQTFYLRERFGYSLNGLRFEIAQGQSYTGIVDRYNDTTAKILSGTNSNDETDLVGRALTKTVNTGWVDGGLVDDAASDLFTLWGLVDNLSLYDEELTGNLPNGDESQVTDTYTLSISYNPRKIRGSKLMRGGFCIAARDENDAWVNAVELNEGGTKIFKRGPWKSGYELGTYGVDPSSKTVWAVLNHESDFVAKLV